MSDTQQIEVSATMVVAVLASVVGFAAFWSNPKRSVNGGFFAASLSVSVWLLCLGQAVQGGPNHQFWAQATAIAGAAIFVPVWFIKEAIVKDGQSPWGILQRGWGWIAACVILGGVRAVNWFLGTINVSFWIFVVGLVVLYGILTRNTIREIRLLDGLKRLELQIALLGGCATGLTVVLLLIIRTVTGLPWVTRLYPLIILVFYTGTAIAITTSRIFNARQLLIFALQKAVLIVTVILFVFSATRLLTKFVADPIAWLIVVALALWFSTLLKEWLDSRFAFYPHGGAARQAALVAAQRETRVEKLDGAFCSVLKGWGQTDKAIILSGANNQLSGRGFELSADCMIAQTMRHLKWATPERLARERSNPDRAAVAKFLADQGFGAIVTTEGPSLTVLIGVGKPVSRRPFTYPQITQLLELASIMESALERAHFSAKVQHTEQLATVGLLGASLAHEIRNPLVSIKTFVQLLPTHHHDPKFREKFFRLIGDEVGRIDQLTQQLLDLASPRTYAGEVIELHPVLRTSLDLVAAKAAHKSVRFLTDFRASPDRAFTDASAAKQVILNLCFNAIQAVESCNQENRWVKIATSNLENGIEMIVADSGPGISEEMRPRLFQPFQTTKSTGFGLGLAICSDILANLNASISVDPPQPGQGATFRVTFPCQPSSS